MTRNKVHSQGGVIRKPLTWHKATNPMYAGASVGVLIGIQVTLILGQFIEAIFWVIIELNPNVNIRWIIIRYLVESSSFL